MPSIGALTKQTDGTYTGELATVTFTTPLRLVPVAQKRTEAAPDFRLFGRAPNGRAVDLGAAWIKSGREDGGEYVSLKIDAPELPEPLYATLGQMADQDDPDVMAIIWNRRNGR